MYNYKIMFIKKSETSTLEKKILENKIYDYLLSLSYNGQLINDFNIFIKDSNYYVSITTLEKDSLSSVNNGGIVKEKLTELEIYFEIKVLYKGVHIESVKVCKCNKSSFYFLYANTESSDYPVLCGDCSNFVPIYKIPLLFNDKEHYAIRHWSHSYKNIFSLWLNGLDDKYTYKQQSSYNSKLSREGRAICKELKRVFGTPVYYYLFNFDNCNEGISLNNIKKTCLVCSSNLELSKKNSKFYKCDKCEILIDNPNFSRE